ncbi:glycogen/starch/alpha-glucan phosphorylase [Pseudomonas prosekii]|uniref:glycogen/starch/alpha-glucan phosphorylase n=1 Tax=Pseudomonas prosekii TaxID=1148509 RepID=UPI0011EAF137|nr:glycogen/starch/alpha-glucan phosphorylase [Pseudomonas prosekii]
MTDHIFDDSDFERLMKIKALNKERLAFRRGAWRAEYEALSPEEKALVDKEFNKICSEIAAQFSRSRPVVFEGNDTAEPNKSSC